MLYLVITVLCIVQQDLLHFNLFLDKEILETLMKHLFLKKFLLIMNKIIKKNLFTSMALLIKKILTKGETNTKFKIDQSLYKKTQISKIVVIKNDKFLGPFKITTVLGNNKVEIN